MVISLIIISFNSGLDLYAKLDKNHSPPIKIPTELVEFTKFITRLISSELQRFYNHFCHHQLLIYKANTCFKGETSKTRLQRTAKACSLTTISPSSNNYFNKHVSQLWTSNYITLSKSLCKSASTKWVLNVLVERERLRRHKQAAVLIRTLGKLTASTSKESISLENAFFLFISEFFAKEFTLSRHDSWLEQSAANDNNVAYLSKLTMKESKGKPLECSKKYQKNQPIWLLLLPAA